MDFSPETRTVLSILNDFEHKKKLFVFETISIHDYWVQQRKGDQALIKILDQLIDCELVSRTGNTYSLTKQGVIQAKKFMSEGFSAMMIASEQSATSRKFCKQVYGLDLCQFNMMSQTQLDKLLEVMNLCKDDHILDLGCGIGLISEYISDVTGASVTGIDFASGAIKRAQKRTHKKRGQLSYQVMDMDELSLPGKSFSGMISIDALHFVNDLKRTIQLTKECLQENGQMGIFYSTTISPEETIESLEPEQTPLAKVLKECGLNFQTWDFTQDEIEIWEKILHVAEELRHEYDAEGNLYIYEMSVSDARPMLETAKTGRCSRYFYHIR
jgi:cyclopropane fatty-acyl-phospholipid synthase-like methyltransferase